MTNEQRDQFALMRDAFLLARQHDDYARRVFAEVDKIGMELKNAVIEWQGSHWEIVWAGITRRTGELFALLVPADGPNKQTRKKWVKLTDLIPDVPPDPTLAASGPPFAEPSFN